MWEKEGIKIYMYELYLIILFKWTNCGTLWLHCTLKIYENTLGSNWVQAKENVRDKRQKPKPNQNKKPSRQTNLLTVRGRKKRS